MTIGACFMPCSLSHASSLGKKMCKNYKIWNTLYEVGQIYCKQHDLIPIGCPFCETKFRKSSLSKELGNIYVTHGLKKQPGKEVRWICNLDFWCYINCKSSTQQCVRNRSLTAFGETNITLPSFHVGCCHDISLSSCRLINIARTVYTV